MAGIGTSKYTCGNYFALEQQIDLFLGLVSMDIKHSQPTLSEMCESVKVCLLKKSSILYQSVGEG